MIDQVRIDTQWFVQRRSVEHEAALATPAAERIAIGVVGEHLDHRRHGNLEAASARDAIHLIDGSWTQSLIRR